MRADCSQYKVVYEFPFQMNLKIVAPPKKKLPKFINKQGSVHLVSDKILI